MHFHRAHSGKIITDRQRVPVNGNVHHRMKVNGEIDRRTKAWRKAHPRLAKRLGPKDAVDRALEHFASSSVPKFECPQCHFDLNRLTDSAVPAKVCPGCGTPFQTFVDRLFAVLRA